MSFNFLFGAVAGIALSCGLVWPADGQTRCTRDGDWLVCEDGERYAIRLDPFARPRAGGRGEPGFSGDGARDAWMTDAALLHSSDGVVCWRHGNHAHCQ